MKPKIWLLLFKLKRRCNAAIGYKEQGTWRLTAPRLIIRCSYCSSSLLQRRKHCCNIYIIAFIVAVHSPYSWEIDGKIHFLNCFIRKLFYYMYGCIKCLWFSEMLIVLIGLFVFRYVHANALTHTASEWSRAHSVSQPASSMYIGNNISNGLVSIRHSLEHYYYLTFKLVLCAILFRPIRWIEMKRTTMFETILTSFVINERQILENKLVYLVNENVTLPVPHKCVIVHIIISHFKGFCESLSNVRYRTDSRECQTVFVEF